MFTKSTRKKWKAWRHLADDSHCKRLIFRAESYGSKGQCCSHLQKAIKQRAPENVGWCNSVCERGGSEKSGLQSIRPSSFFPFIDPHLDCYFSEIYFSSLPLPIYSNIHLFNSSLLVRLPNLKTQEKRSVKQACRKFCVLYMQLQCCIYIQTSNISWSSRDCWGIPRSGNNPEWAMAMV